MRNVTSLFVALTLAAAACDSSTRPAAPGPVNDQYMGAPQIPVEVAGKMYFGCCAACRDKLMTDVAVRTAHDPVTHAVVDKSTAVIGRAPDGKVLYFASEENLIAYRP